MKNTLQDLNNHLFMELERLNDEDLGEDKIAVECTRAKALSKVADKILSNASIMLEAKKYFDEMGTDTEQIPKMLRLEDKNDKK